MNLKKHLPWLGALLPIANTQAETKPNVVIIYIDDMGIGDIGCYGGKFVPTPNIDKLAQDGLLFNQYYSSAPVSSPSRCGLTTGLFPLEVGINTFLNDKAANKRCEQRNFLDDKLPSMARAFQMQVTQQDTSENGTWEADVTCIMLLLLKITVLTNTYQPMKVRIRNQQSLLPNGSGRIKTA